MQTDSAEQ